MAVGGQADVFVDFVAQFAGEEADAGWWGGGGGRRWSVVVVVVLLGRVSISSFSLSHFFGDFLWDGWGIFFFDLILAKGGFFFLRWRKLKFRVMSFSQR